MRILIIGKYPPIEGGVSSHTYWLARSLGERGHVVSVVTNALRVEEQYRLSFPHHEQSVRDLWRPSNVSLYSITHEAPRHIPYSEAFVTRLANLALKSIAERGADVIYAHYLEPFATAGFLVKQCTGLPLVVRHSGSDVYRLLKSSDFSLMLARVLQGADRVMMGPVLHGLVQTLGISANRRVAIPSTAVHPLFFPRSERRNNHSDIPTIAYMGKATKRKGILELITAVGKMRNEVRLVLVTDGPLLPEIMKAIEGGGEIVRRRVTRVPFMAPWEVPAFLQQVDMLAHLENDFPIPIHAPQQPYEAIAAQTPLLLSADMAQKMRSQFPDIGSNAVVVQDLQNSEALAHSLDGAFDDLPSLREKAKVLSHSFSNDWDAHILSHERILADAYKAARFRRIARTLLHR